MSDRLRVQRSKAARDERPSRARPAERSRKGEDLRDSLTHPSPGKPMDALARGALEPRFGHSFANIRLHADGEGDERARAVDALAFTVGHDIYFRAGEYDPGSGEGMRLLAHEAAHTIQQAAGPVAGLPATGGIRVSDPSDSFERAASEAADAAMSGEDAGDLLGQEEGALANDSVGAVPVQRAGPGGFIDIPDWVTEGDPEAWPVRKFWQDPHNPRWYPKAPEPPPPGFEGQPRPYPIRQPPPESPLPDTDPVQPPEQQPWQGPPEDWEGPETLRSPGTEAGAEATETATEAATEAGEVAVEGGEVVEGAEAAVEGGEVLLEGGALGGEAAAGLGAAEFGLLGLAGYGGYKFGEAIGEGVIDPYLNRAHSEEIPAEQLAKEQEQIRDPTITNYADTVDEGYKESWAYKMNQWLEE
jgi:hypothetical protein